jgi:riboflavin kinase/FMN adenylyltransferase
MQILRHLPAIADKPAALTIGNFDGMHLGHQAIFAALREKAKVQGLVASVMTFEPHPREFFAPDQAPTRLTSLREKLEQFDAAGMERVYVCRFGWHFAEIGAREFIGNILRRALDVRLIMVGDDFRFGERRAGTLNDLRDAGLTVENLHDVTLGSVRVSSTAVRQALAAGDIDRAAALLGRPYSISGKVVQGHKLGRELGYPTANIHMRHDKPPLSGIYAVKLRGITAEDLPGVASLGVRPTVNDHGKATLEVHLFDFSRDIYGCHVHVNFRKKLREEKKFPNMETLKRQIALDELAARDYFAMEVK